MKYHKLGTKLGAVSSVLALSISGGGFATIASAQSMSGSTHPVQANRMLQRYRVNLRPLNNSGVHGFADITLMGRELTVKVRASGMTPNMTHAQHIHGQSSDMGAAECPTAAQDLNNDNFISVTEGAPTYGPIKLSLTNPQTPFGPNDTVLNGVKLFTDFAGKPAPENFPKADANGNLSFSNTYTFDTNDAAAKAAFETLNPLTDQEVVLHGAMAPSGVETLAGGGATMAYDGLLPVACARITAVGNHHSNGVHGQGGQGNENERENVSINNTGPGSTNSINTSSSNSSQSTNNTNVNVNNQSSQTAVTGRVTSSGNAGNSFEPRSNGFNPSDWTEANPLMWQTDGHSFNKWWSHTNMRMTQYNANDWTLGSAANNSWSPAGDNWQNTWSNWDPALWQANGQSYGNWYGQMLGHMTGNYNNWMHNWNGSGGNATSGAASNMNNTNQMVAIENN